MHYFFSWNAFFFFLDTNQKLFQGCFPGRYQSNLIGPTSTSFPVSWELYGPFIQRIRKIIVWLWEIFLHVFNKTVWFIVMYELLLSRMDQIFPFQKESFDYLWSRRDEKRAKQSFWVFPECFTPVYFKNIYWWLSGLERIPGKERDKIKIWDLRKPLWVCRCRCAPS